MNAIEIRNELLITLLQAARLLPPGRRGRPVTLSCLLRWVLDGVKTPTGIVRLEAIRLGGRWLTSVEALERFAARQTPDLESGRPALPRSPTKQQRAAARASRQLAKLGI